jgi:hypothetical protein
MPESLQYGIDNKEKAKQIFEKITGLNVSSCCLFVDNEKTFLGASPDGLVDLDSIVEIKSPFVPRNTDIKWLVAKRPRRTGPVAKRLAANRPRRNGAAKRHRPCCTILYNYCTMFLRIFTVLIKSSECYWKHLQIS